MSKYSWIYTCKPLLIIQMYDKDDSGTIELSEMTDIIGTLYDMEGVTSSGGEGNISKSKIV